MPSPDLKVPRGPTAAAGCRVERRGVMTAVSTSMRATRLRACKALRQGVPVIRCRQRATWRPIRWGRFVVCTNGLARKLCTQVGPGPCCTRRHMRESGGQSMHVAASRSRMHPVMLARSSYLGRCRCTIALQSPVGDDTYFERTGLRGFGVLGRYKRVKGPVFHEDGRPRV